MDFHKRKRKIIYNNSVEATEAITFWTETKMKKGRKLEKWVAVPLWPDEEEIQPTSGLTSELTLHQDIPMRH